MTNPQPGWYRDPSNSSQLRWWDGSQWTSYTQAATGATNGTTPAGRVTTSSSAYSAVPAHPSASTTGSAQAQYPSAQASSAQPQAPFAQVRPSSAQPQAPFAQARPAPAPAQAPLAQPQARPSSAQPQPRYTGAPQASVPGAPQASVPGAPQAGYSAAPTRPSYASAPQPAYASTTQPAYGSSSTSSFPGAPAAPMAPARPAKPAKPKKPSAWTGKQKFLTVMYVLLTVAFTVSGFALMNSAQHNQDRASILDTQIQPLRQSVAEQQKKLDALNKQLEGSGK